MGLKKENNREALILEARGKIQCKCIKKKKERNGKEAMILKLKSESKKKFDIQNGFNHLIKSKTNARVY